MLQRQTAVMSSAISRWEFIFTLAKAVSLEKAPSLENFKFDTDKKGTIKGFHISIDNSPDRKVTDEEAKQIATKMASLFIQLFVASSGVPVDCLYGGMDTYRSGEKHPKMSRFFPLQINITRLDIPFDISNETFGSLLDDKDYYLSALIEFTSYAIRSHYRGNPIGAILCAYLATGDNPKVFEKCNIKGTRRLRNALVHRKDKNDHEKNLAELEKCNSCKIQRNGKGFLDLDSSANLGLINRYASEMIGCLRQSINDRLNIETVNAYVQL